MEHKESLGWELKRMSNTIGSFIGAELTKAGFDEIIITHGWILGYLCHHEDTVIYQKDIETRFCMPRSTVANVMKQFEQMGYIKRQSDEKDTRLKRIIVTDIGKKVHEDSMKSIFATNEKMEEGISDKERQTLHNIFDKISENMKRSGFEGGTIMTKS
ncbi:MAG: winged helix-turn-helix transcriptional regulator [Lachnospiraceae bacterium]|nr:winged helix-turn-helix transcriptional regulator [Lachnospiraceae bacterium]